MRPELVRLSLDTPLIAGNTLAVMLSSIREGMAAELPWMKEMKKTMKSEMVRVGEIAMIPVKGVLARNPSLYEMACCDFEDIEQLDDMCKIAESDPEIRGVLLDIDSPGGFVNGTPEMADSVAALAKKKCVIAFTAGMACSAAYWIASQATAVISTRSAIVGSIGVYSALYDLSAYYAEMGVKVEVATNKEATFKAAGLPGTSLSDEQRANWKASVQRDFDEFAAAVTGARPQIQAESMQGQTFNGKQAKAAGLVDGIGDKAFALSYLRSKLK